MTVTKLDIKGMHCASCKTLIEEVCTDASGVRSCMVDIDAGTASVEHDDSFDPAILVHEIRSLGGDYKATIL